MPPTIVRNLFIALILTSWLASPAPVLAGTTTAVVTADANVKQARPNANFGAVANIAAQASTTAEVRGYFTVSFTVPDGETIDSASLHLFAKTTSAIGYAISLSNSTAWSESTLTWKTQPGVGAPVAASGPITRGHFSSLDVTSALIGQSGQVTIGFVMTTTDPTLETVASRNDPNLGHLPYLTVTSSPAPPPPQGPCAQAGGTTTAGGTLDHVIVVAMENHQYDSILGTGTDAITPYIHELATECGSARNFVDSSQPSLPNYLDLVAGQHPDYMDNVSAGRITGKGDCTPYLVLSDVSRSPCYSADDNLFHQLAGDFTAYGESAQSACRASNATTGWLPRHVPSLYFSDLATGQTDCTMAQPLPADLSTIDITKRFTFITPNECHDMHSVTSAVDGTGGCDAAVPPLYNSRSYGTAFPNGCWDGASNDTCTRERGDQFLSDLIPALTGSSTYAAGRTAIVLWWDEDGIAGVGAAPVPLIVISPYTQPGDGNFPTPMTNQDLLLAFEDLLGLPTLDDLGTTPYAWVSGPAEVNDPGAGSTGRADLRSFFHLN